MAISFLFLYFLAFAAATTSHASIPPEDLKTIHPLRPTATATASHPLPGIDCLSWRLAVETDNIKNWDLVPATCENYVGHYMLGMQYRHDCDVVADVAIKYSNTLRIPKDGRSIWVFDIDETAFSNLPYYARPDVAFGAKPYNATSFDEYAATANVPALPASLRLYQNLVKLGIKAVFITGSSTSLEKARIINLKRVGYYTWEKLVLKDSSDKTTSLVFKSEERTKLVAQGYRIVGNIGDQWSDILGNNTGSRTFKLPDPMYYVA